jgi:hypothetical protein
MVAGRHMRFVYSSKRGGTMPDNITDDWYTSRDPCRCILQNFPQLYQSCNVRMYRITFKMPSLTNAWKFKTDTSIPAFVDVITVTGATMTPLLLCPLSILCEDLKTHQRIKGNHGWAKRNLAQVPDFAAEFNLASAAGSWLDQMTGGSALAEARRGAGWVGLQRIWSVM